jgi:hypothetical protein
MNGHPTRRGFLQTAITAGGCLALEGFSKTAHTAPPPAPQSISADPQRAVLAQDSPGTAVNAPLIVVTQSVSKDVQARSGSWCYISEILRRAGVFFEQLAPARLPALFHRSNCVVLLAGNLSLGLAEREALAAWVKGGGALVGIGGTSGLNEVFGVTGESPLADGWIKVTAPDHAVTAGLRSSLHVFGGYVMKRGPAQSLAEVEMADRLAKGSVILENRFGKGLAMLLAPDLLFSIVHIQQGLPVFQDGKPSPDDSAAVNEGVLKAEDGLVLDWRRDRTPLPPDNVPVFIEPISDELREIILRSIFHVARQQGVALSLLWYWPRSLKAVGQVSHDTDGNDPQNAAAMLGVMNRCRLKSTWCTLFPGGYPKEFYRNLQKQDFEIALHYDAMSGGAQTSWSKENLVLQHRWLMETAGLKHITSNKNHYTRWESRLAFYRWCEELGINSDQTRGPSKKGTIGFPLGGSQPYFPLDDEAAAPRFPNVLEVNMLTQDLVVVCPAEYGKPLLDSALRHHGVAHFLFHPAHIRKPSVADALWGLVDYGRTQGLEWWTNEQIYQWEMLRRGVKAKFDAGNALTLRTAQPLHKATLLFLRLGEEPCVIRVNGQVAQGMPWNLHGFEFDALTADIEGEIHVLS